MNLWEAAKPIIWEKLVHFHALPKVKPFLYLQNSELLINYMSQYWFTQVNWFALPDRTISPKLAISEP